MEDINAVIGRLLTDDELLILNRDATHVALLPVVAGEDLEPGEHVGYKAGYAYGAEPFVGIVDPFLSVDKVMAGSGFLLFIYPRTVTGLTHQWKHPTIDKEDATAADTVKLKAHEEPASAVRDRLVTLHAEAVASVEEFAETISQTYDDLMRAAESYHSDGDVTLAPEGSYDVDWDKWTAFWKNYYLIRSIERLSETGSPDDVVALVDSLAAGLSDASDSGIPFRCSC